MRAGCVGVASSSDPAQPRKRERSQQAGEKACSGHGSVEGSRRSVSERAARRFGARSRRSPRARRRPAGRGRCACAPILQTHVPWRGATVLATVRSGVPPRTAEHVSAGSDTLRPLPAWLTVRAGSVARTAKRRPARALAGTRTPACGVAALPAGADGGCVPVPLTAGGGGAAGGGAAGGAGGGGGGGGGAGGGDGRRRWGRRRRRGAEAEEAAAEEAGRRRRRRRRGGAGGLFGPGPEPNSCTNDSFPSEPRATATPVYANLVPSMFALWPAELSQAETTEAAEACPRAMFSPQYDVATG